MRDSMLLALVLSLGVVGCNSFQGLVGKKASSETAAAVTAPAGESGDATADGDEKEKAKSCPVMSEGEDDSGESGDAEADKKAAKDKDKEKSGEYEETGLTHDDMGHESDDDWVSEEGKDS